MKYRIESINLLRNKIECNPYTIKTNDEEFSDVKK